MKRYTAILVDDMPEAVDVLKLDLQAVCPELDIVATADSVVSAAKLLRREQPDILFLDILLGDGTGFDLLEIFPNIRSKLIFITASDEFALRAFRFAAIDYLLKPINRTDLREAVTRAFSTITSPERIDLLKESIRHPERLSHRLSLPAHEKISIVDIDEIVRCEADGNGTIFVMSEGPTIYVTKTLKLYEGLLSGHAFMRVHQSHLVSLHHVQEYIRSEGGYLIMKNGNMVSVSVRKKQQVIDRLGRL